MVPPSPVILSKEDTRRAARPCREAIALRPRIPYAYLNLGGSLANSGHHVDSTPLSSIVPISTPQDE